MAETFCSSGSVKLKAGANVSTSLTAAHYTELINQAESYINAQVRVNYTDTYAALNADVQKIIEDAASSHAAIGAINYDMSGFTSRAEALNMVNINIYLRDAALRLLKDKKVTTFIDNA